MQSRISVCLLFLVAGTLAATGDPVADKPGVLDELRSSDAGRRFTARRRILEDRKSLISGLIEIVRTAPDDDGAEKVMPGLGLKRTAIEVLGAYRAEEAVPVLFGALKYRVAAGYGSTGDESNLSRNYPAAESLIKIGHPALERTWSRIQISDDPLEQQLCCWILCQIEGKETARRLLDEKAKTRTDRLQKARYEHARALLDEDRWVAEPP